MISVEIYEYDELPKEVQVLHVADSPEVSDEFLVIDTGLEFDAIPLETTEYDDLAAWLREKFEAASDLSENDVYRKASALCEVVEDLLAYLGETNKEALLDVGPGLDFNELLEKAVNDFNDACDNEGLIIDEALQ